MGAPHIEAKKIRCLVYTWLSTGVGVSVTDPLLETMEAMKATPMVLRVKAGETLVAHALAIGTAPSCIQLGTCLMNLYIGVRSVTEFVCMVAVANLSFYGITGTHPSPLATLGLATRNTLVVSQHFINGELLHSYLRIINYDIQHIPCDHPFALSAVCYWAIREVWRGCIRWDVDRMSPFPEIIRYITRATNTIRHHGHSIEVVRVVFTILCVWFVVESAAPLPPPHVVEATTNHIQWREKCSTSYRDYSIIH